MDRIVIVGASLAERLWPGSPAVGEQITIAGSGNVYDVIGVVVITVGILLVQLSKQNPTQA